MQPYLYGHMATHEQQSSEAYLIEGDDRVEMAVSVPQVVGRLRDQRQLRLWPDPGEQSCLQQPVAVCLDVLQDIHACSRHAWPTFKHCEGQFCFPNYIRLLT